MSTPNQSTPQSLSSSNSETRISNAAGINQTSPPSIDSPPASAQRPPLRPSSSSLHQSSSSILTMSKLYQQQQQQQGASSAKRVPPKPPSSSKKPHKRVLSSNSLSDYFTPRSGNASPSESSEQVPSVNRVSPGPRLPTFQRIDSFGHLNDKVMDPDDPNMSSSKIFARRMMKQNEEALHDDIEGARIDEAMDEDNNDDNEMITQKYKQKMESMRNKKAEFFNSDSESEDNLSSDEDPVSAKGPSQLQSHQSTVSGSSSTAEFQKDKNSDSENNEPHSGGIKRFLRRLTVSEGHDDGIPDRIRNKFDEAEANEGGFFSKFVNLSGGGLIPGANNSEQRKKINDEEAQRETNDGIEMQALSPELFSKEASDIIQAHSRQRAGSKSKSYTTDHSDERTLKDSVTSGDDSFLVPNPDLYLRDEDNIFELNLDGANKSDSYISPPETVRGGVLSSLLKLYQNPTEGSRSRLTLTHSADASPYESMANSPFEEREDEYFAALKPTLSGKLKNLASNVGKKKVTIDGNNLAAQQSRISNHRKHNSFTDVSQLKEQFKEQFLKPDSNMKKKVSSTTNLPSFARNSRPKMKKGASAIMKSKREQVKARITVHIAEILQRQRFILRMCKALMLYGAPTHRLEEYLTMTARVLEIDAQFIYLPGCMIISFGDATTRTSEVQLVRCNQGLDLYKLHRVHRIYKQVIHDIVGVEEASVALDELLAQKPQFPPWVCVLIYAFSSAMVTPFAFGGGWVNLPVSFAIGGCVGFLQFYISPRSNLYSNVFEVTASIVVSFIGRALGSIEGSHICFSAVVQGSLALILPGYIILCGSLELQSRNLVAGSVRMFYAMIYSLLLGFGITLGAAIYGWIDKNATSATTCSESINPWWRFLFVPMFTLGLATINQAKWFQLPIMLVVSCAGYVVSYFASKHFYDSTEFTAAMGAFVIGILGNLYSRVWKGLAVSAMLPAIFVQVPSGIASQGSLLSGIESANKLVSNTTSSGTGYSSGLSFGINMVQVAIGISVGLFASTIAVYPFGKKSTSVFTL